MKKLLTCICIVAILYSCKNNGMSGSPKSVVSSFIEASKSGNFEDIKKYISRSDVSMMEIGENFLSKMDPNGVKDMKDKMAKEFQEKTKDATYQLGEEKIDGDNATVQISFTHQGKTESHPLSLVKEDGKWKVSLMSTGMNMAGKNKEEVAKAVNSINLDSLKKSVQGELGNINIDKDSMNKLMDEGMKELQKLKDTATIH